MADAVKIKPWICLHCGWYDSDAHADQCSPGAGRSADELAALLPGIPSTKLGYGDRRLAFKIEGDRTIVFSCMSGGRFRLDLVFWGAGETSEARRLVWALAAVAAGRDVEEEVRELRADNDRLTKDHREGGSREEG